MVANGTITKIQGIKTDVSLMFDELKMKINFIFVDGVPITVLN